MSVTIEVVDTPNKLKEFVQFPYDLYKGNAFWVPPLKSEEIKALQPSTNPAFKNCTTCFWIARLDGKPVGRVGAFIHADYNKKIEKKLCRLTRIEFIDDKEVSKLLFATAEQWAKEMGMEAIHGPLGFTNLDHQGVLVEGFDHLPSIASEYHLPYYKEHFEAAGYQKEMDWVEFRLKLDKEIPEKALKLNNMIQQRYQLKVVHFKKAKEMKAYAAKIFLLLNIAFGSLFSFVNIDDEIAEFYTRKYFSILNPKFVKVVEDKDQKPVAFIVSMPSLSQAMQLAKGKLLPFGWYHIRGALQKPKVVDLLLTAIHPDYQSQGVIAILITELQKVMQEHNVEYVETTGMLETNDKAINNWKNYDHIQHKRKRCFIKMLV